MKDTDPFITPVPYQYEFQMMKVDSQGNVIPELNQIGIPLLAIIIEQIRLMNIF
jgi:hypothetical protein